MSLGNINLQQLAQELSIPTQQALDILQQLQRLPEAWEFAFTLLSSENVNCRFYGAHTLKNKIAKDWDSLDEERQEALRYELLQLVAKHCVGPLPVLNKINQALIVYVLQMAPDRWENFLTTVTEEILRLGHESGIDSVHVGYAVVDILQLFPEELLNISFASNHIARLNQDIAQSLSTVFSILTNIARGITDPEASTSADIPEYVRQLGRDPAWRTRAWKAILKWLQYGIKDDKLFIPLVGMTIKQLQVLAAQQLGGSTLPAESQVTDEEVEAATLVLDDMFSNESMASRFGKTISTLVLEHYTQPWLIDAISRCAGEHDDHAVLQWCMPLISFGEVYMEPMINNITNSALSRHIETYFQIMLDLTRFPGYYAFDEDISGNSLEIWYLLQEAIVSYDPETDDAETNVEKLEQTRQSVRSVFLQVLQALLVKAAYPPTDAWLDADKDDKARFLSYQREVGETLLTTYYVLRDEMLALLVDETIAALSVFSLDNWQQLDVLLLALKYIGESVPDTEDTHLPRLFTVETLSQRFLPLLQSNLDADTRTAQWGLISIKSSVLSLIGAYGEWWKSHPELLPIVVPCVTSSLNQHVLVAKAVVAFRSICDSCRDQLAGAADSMVQLAREVLLAGTTVPPREQKRIFESVAEVIMALAPEQQAAAVEPLVVLILERLRSDVILLESAPRGTSLTDLEPYWTPLLNHLSLVDSIARGLEFADDVEERALVGDPEAIDVLVRAAHCYESAAALQEFRRSLLALMNHVVASEVWLVGHQSGDMRLIPDGLLECMLSIVNSTSRRGPHIFALTFGEVTSLIGESWSRLVVSQSAGSTVYAQRWIEQCPMFLQCISQLVTVFTGKTNSWQPMWPGTEETNQTFGTILTRVLDDTILGIAREADDMATAVEQLPNVNEVVFDLCTRSLQSEPNVFVHISQPTLARVCELSAQALSIPNRLALKPAAYFLTALTRLSSESQPDGPVKQLFHMMWTQYGLLWIRTTVGGIGGTHPRSLLANLSELLFSMVKNNPTTARAWLAELLAQQRFPSAHVDDKDKQLFLRQAVSTRSFTRFKTTVTEFSIRCRNLQGTAYAA